MTAKCYQHMNNINGDSQTPVRWEKGSHQTRFSKTALALPSEEVAPSQFV